MVNTTAPFWNFTNPTINPPINQHECVKWCEEQITTQCTYNQTRGITIMAITLITLSIASAIADHSQTISQKLNQPEQKIVSIAWSIHQFSLILIATAVIYYAFFN